MRTRRLFVAMGAALLALSTLGFSQSALAEIAAQYPGDEGIASDPRVLFVEDFEAANLAEIASRYTQTSLAGMTITVDTPALSGGFQSLALDASRGNGYLYRNLTDTPNTLYVRKYIKYQPNKVYHHLGVWYGSYSPATPWAQGRAGDRTPPTHFSVGAEEQHPVGKPSGNGRMLFGFYNYWPGMNANRQGIYWGAMLPTDNNLTIPTDEWVCVESMIKLDEPVEARNGELALWIDGEQVVHFKPGSPTGRWEYLRYFLDPNGQPFEGLDWRGNDPELKVNWLWILNHPSSEVAENQRGTIWVDHVVVARDYIGPLSEPGSPGARRPPDPPILLDD